MAFKRREKNSTTNSMDCFELFNKMVQKSIVTVETGHNSNEKISEKQAQNLVNTREHSAHENTKLLYEDAL